MIVCESGVADVAVECRLNYEKYRHLTTSRYARTSSLAACHDLDAFIAQLRIRSSYMSSRWLRTVYHLRIPTQRRSMATKMERTYSVSTSTSTNFARLTAQDALDCLNSLQSNYQTIQAFMKSGGNKSDRAIPEMLDYTSRIGYQV